jgi:hypothetical protein
LSDIPLVDDAVVEVTLRGSNGAGDSGDGIGHGAIGRVDLSGSADTEVLDIGVSVGGADTFAETTDTRHGACAGMLRERQGHTATALEDGRVFIAGGQRKNQTSASYWSETELFDPVEGTYAHGPDMKWTRKGHTATRLDDGRVLLAGGIGLSESDEDTWLIAQVYSPDANSFGPPLTMEAQRAYHTGTLLADGRVLLAGGVFGDRELQSTEIFDPKSNGFSPGPTLAQQRSHHAAVRVGPSTVAIIGGRGSGDVLASVEFVVLDGTPRVVAGPSLSQKRSHLVAEKVPGLDAVVVAGGFGTLLANVDKPETGTGLEAVEILEIDRNSLGSSRTRCTTLELSTPRGDAAMAAVGEDVLVMGGVVAPSQLAASADRIHVTSLAGCNVQITPTAGTMAAQRAEPRVAPLLGGDLLVVGGFSMATGKVVSLDLSEFYVVAP